MKVHDSIREVLDQTLEYFGNTYVYKIELEMVKAHDEDAYVITSTAHVPGGVPRKIISNKYPNRF